MNKIFPAKWDFCITCPRHKLITGHPDDESFEWDNVGLHEGLNIF